MQYVPKLYEIYGANYKINYIKGYEITPELLSLHTDILDSINFKIEDFICLG